MEEVATDKDIISMQEQEIQDLQTKVSTLYGRLGAEGLKVSRETRYQEIEIELKNAYVTIEKMEKDKEDLRDMFAAKAMQGVLANHAIYDGATPFDEPPAKNCYKIADAMLKARVNQEDR